MEKEQNRGMPGEDMSGYSPMQMKMATDNLASLVLRYSVPTVIGMLVNALYNVVDRFWIGKIGGEVGTLALTGVGLIMPIMNLLMGFAQLVGIGAASAISIRLGQNDKKGAQKVLNNSFVLSVIFSILISIFGTIFAPDILRMVGASEATLPYALPYCRITIAFNIFQMTSFSMNHCIRATGNPKRFASTQFLGAIVNMIADPIFIFGFGWGTAGAAVATIVAQCVSASWVFSFYFSKKSELRFKLPDMKLDPKIILAVFSVGLSPFLMQISGALVNGILNNTLYSYGGDLAVGAMTLISSISTLFFMPVIGINQGVQPIIGFNYGRNDMKRVKQAYWYAVLYGSIICAFGWISIQLFAPQLVLVFNKNEGLVEAASFGMKVFLFGLPVIGYQSQSSNFFNAIGRAKLSIILSAMRQIILLIPLYIILPQFFGLNGIWFAGPIADTLSAVLAGIFVIFEFKRLDKKNSFAVA